MKLLINGEERSFADDLTLAALVEQLGVKADRVAIELNHNIVRRDAWAATKLREGDRLEVVHFVGGGTAHNDTEALLKGRLEKRPQGSKRMVILYALGAIGLFVIAVGSLLMFYLEEHTYDHPNDFYIVLRSYRSVLLIGATLCLVACFVGAVAVKLRTAVIAGIVALGIPFAVVASALVIPVFDIHGPSGPVLWVLVLLPLVGGAILLLVALFRFLWSKFVLSHPLTLL
ncbi:MAG TPA: sulfur carrier protein ThiS [Terriglobales bacterium]|jgi:thiamine biosynthesis protein ThiS|nr:sulfur carrier protein ThiS [Terriglobales bacterium]